VSKWRARARTAAFRLDTLPVRADFLECLQSGGVEEFQRSGSGMAGDCARGR